MRGIYFLASDAVRELVVAFLNSVRTFEPLLPMCLIPFDSNVDWIRTVCSEYDFSVWSDEAALNRCDEISLKFHSQVCGQYRKLATWSGPFDEFAYIDVDTVLLSVLDAPMRLLDEYDVICGVSNLQSLRQFVWRGDVNAIEPSLDTAYSANTGFIISRKDAITLDFADALLVDAAKIRQFMALQCAEQPFLNYLVVRSGLRYSSLSAARRKDPSSKLPVEVWAGMFDENILCLRKRPLLVHWAGLWQSGKHLSSPTWLHFRHLRANSQSKDATA